MPDDRDMFTLAEAARRLPQRRGRNVHLLTIKRWVTKGVCGVRLSACKVGGVWYTCQAWVDEFVAACTSATKDGEPRFEPRRASYAQAELHRRYGFDPPSSLPPIR